MTTDELKTLLADHMIMLADSRKDNKKLVEANMELMLQIKNTQILKEESKK